MLLVSRICLLSSSGVQSFFLLLRAIGCKLFGGAGAKKTLPTVFRLLLRPLLGYTTFRRRRSPCVTGLELFFAARFGRPGVFCLSRTVGLRYFPAGPEEKQQNDNIVFESPWCFCLNALKFCFPLDSTTFRRGSSKGKKTKHLFERAETCNTFLRVGGLIPWLRSFSPFASAPSMAFRKLFFMAHGHPADYVGGAFFGSIGLFFFAWLVVCPLHLVKSAQGV